MKSIRLLPVVIFAALALLVFKGIGIVTNGGYVLLGPTAAIAQGAEGDTPAPISEAVANDTSPVITDTAPSIAVRPEVPGIAPPSSASPASSMGSSVAPSSSMASADSSLASSVDASQPPSGASSAAEACPDAGSSSASSVPHGQGDINDTIGNALARGCAAPPTPLNEHGDVLPTTKDGKGHIVPLQFVEGDNSEQAILSRLSERRAELDKRQADLDMREALVAAAETKLTDRTKALADLQAQVNALVDQKQAAEDASFKAVVSMYETMKAKDAAKIFDTLDVDVLLKIARAMNPRNMSPILAAMSSGPAQQLTTALASVTPITTVPAANGNQAALPQIVGQ